MNYKVNEKIASDPMFKFLLEKNRLMNSCIAAYHMGKQSMEDLSKKLNAIAKDISTYSAQFTATQWKKFKAIKSYVDCIEPVQTEKRLAAAQNNDLQKLEKTALESVENSQDLSMKSNKAQTQNHSAEMEA